MRSKARIEDYKAVRKKLSWLLADYHTTDNRYFLPYYLGLASTAKPEFQ
jgi:hypothetical protein